MADGTAYEEVSLLAISHLAAHGEAPVASVAREVVEGLPHVAERAPRVLGGTLAERIERAREAVCATPFDRGAFDRRIAGIEECAEKRYLLAVAAFRAADGATVPVSASLDMAQAMRLDPGNAEYVSFARLLADNLEDRDLRRAIAEEQELIRRLAARGVSERGRWV